MRASPDWSMRVPAPFEDLTDFCRRTRLPPRLVENLILAGAFDGWKIPRRKLLWELGKLHYQVEELDLIFVDDGVSCRSCPPSRNSRWNAPCWVSPPMGIRWISTANGCSSMAS